ncbi:MAG TPA: polyprenol monophosphomannose synthase [Bacteroidota bacterium]|nr:polyprenol monophosphomannose synthase [Bacteroidota bacterium]
MPKALVITPTYNESANISSLIPKVLHQSSDLEILIVDDNSPDGTAATVKSMQEKNPRIHLIERSGKMGLGTAYVAGFKYAIEHGYDYIFEMDADFSHNPKELLNFLVKIEDFDLVIGSRYCRGVSVVYWPFRRLLLSYFANLYTRIVTGMPVRDATGGFKCYRRAVLESIRLDDIRSNGYAFQIEMNFKAWKKGFRLCEIPIIFVDRDRGESKMSQGIVYEAVFMVWKLKLRSMFNLL